MSLKNFSEEDELMSDINITPMVDVMLVLMLIFLVTAPIITNNLKIDLPNSNRAAKTTDNKEVIKIYIDMRGNLSITADNKITYKELEKLVKNQDQSFQIYADKDAAYQHIAKILGLLKENNISDIGLITEVN